MAAKTKIAIINAERCKPDKCNFECGLICPPNRQKKECIRIVDIEDLLGKKKRIAQIVEDECIGCGLCSRACPHSALILVQIPSELTQHIIHRYGLNGFKLYKMPLLKQGKIFGLIGQNGIGKSSIMNILSNKLKPNFEVSSQPQPTDQEIIGHFKGTEMLKYMTALYKGALKIATKPQHVDQLTQYLKSKSLDPTIGEWIEKKSTYGTLDPWYQQVIDTLELTALLNTKVVTCSGGELQRLVCCTTLLTRSDVYIFDEFTNFLDVRQKLNVAKMIERLVEGEGFDRYVVIVEHDMAILDYISDFVCILYGTPSAYGVVSQPLTTANGINTYFDGYIKSENMRFRKNEYNLVALDVCESQDMKFSDSTIRYPEHTVNYPNFSLCIKEGVVPVEGSLNVILGNNGAGKTTLIRYIVDAIGSSVSYKPQYLSVEEFKKNGSFPTVEDFFMNTIPHSYMNELFRSDVVGPMNIQDIAKRKLNQLSGGECQRFWLVYCLGQSSHVYLIDEPSSMLDIEQRIIVTKVIKRFVVHNRKIAFIVEHDMMMAVSFGNEMKCSAIIVDQMIDQDGCKHSTAHPPVAFNVGLNQFLKSLDVTFRTDEKNKRPRINKSLSVKDREQKLSGQYYC
jgi:ATP-binding cassette subfamily E protein 1